MTLNFNDVTLLNVVDSPDDLAGWLAREHEFNVPRGIKIHWLLNGFQMPAADSLPGFVSTLSEHRTGSEAMNLGIDLIETPITYVSRKPVLRFSLATSKLAELRPEGDVSILSPLVTSGNLVAATGGLLNESCEILPLAAGIPETEFLSDKRTLLDVASSLGMLFSRELFLDAQGFVDSYESQMYADAELSLRMTQAGGGAWFDKSFRVEVASLEPVSILRENTGSTYSDKLQLNQFRSRPELTQDWAARPHAATEIRASAITELTAQMYTPFPLHTGGGERYLLSALETTHKMGMETSLITERKYSSSRISRTTSDLGIAPLQFATMSLADAAQTTEKPNLFLSMGNSLHPPLAARGEHNLYHCQFPFTDFQDASEPVSLDGYSGIIVNSEYTKKSVESRLGEGSLAVHVVHPPVPQFRIRKRQHQDFKILSVGRFFVGDHTKNQDLLIEAFRGLHQKDQRWELHLVGGISAGGVNKEFAERCVALASGLPVRFHFDAPLSTYLELLEQCSIYWHATGLKVDTSLFPERAEHFGISIVEAMSAGIVPLVVANGGPVEYIREGVNGYLYSTEAELVKKTLSFHGLSPQKRATVRGAAIKTARLFDETHFHERLSQVILDSLKVSSINS